MHQIKTIFAALCGLLTLASCATSPIAEIETALYNPEQTGIRWGLVVADLDGTELIAIRADDRFTPGSNTKVITTMASYHQLERLTQSDINSGTQVFIEAGGGPPNLVLKGGGDAMLRDTPDCERACLPKLADDVAALGFPAFGAVIGDDTLFPLEPWGPGWSQEDLKFYYGTAVSALSVNDNLVWVEVIPATEAGAPAQAKWHSGDAYYQLNNQVVTSASTDKPALRVERLPGSKHVRLYGSVPMGSPPRSLRLGVDNPAELTALRFKRLLEARGVAVETIETRHRPLSLTDEQSAPDKTPDATALARPAPNAEPVASLAPSPLTESLRDISKDSQNLYADIAVRRLGLISGTGSRDHGVATLEALMREAGASSRAYAFHGGSGMSIYNRVSPRSMVKLLTFAARQPWFAAWKADQPIGGVDGSLKRRFKGTLLEGRIFAKTGTLNGVNALSGTLIAASGRELAFSIIANDRPSTTRSATPQMDAALLAIAKNY